MFKLSIDTDNAAFDQDMIYPEVARLLRAVAAKIEAGDLDIYGESEMRLFDTNGNRVGKAEFDEGSRT
jgi:hypothetical protein